MNPSQLPEYINGLPNICGSENIIRETIHVGRSKIIFKNEKIIDFKKIKSASAIALHMHQPLIPAGGNNLETADIISNLQYMMTNQGIGDNHNAPVFHWCYKRMGELITQLVQEGKEPRVMLEYSGTLLHGLRAMGLHDVFDNLKIITCNPEYSRTTEWLGCPWGHAVAPSTPARDFRLHVQAWQHHFASIFGLDALERIRGFSPSEMALPNHPDAAYTYVKTLLDCGYQWLLVQEHTVEHLDGQTLTKQHLPHKLVCTNSNGESVSIIAIIKTQGSDTKLVAQMQPYYEAKNLSLWELNGKVVPPLVTQIADGENGGVMMNEFPGKFIDTVREASGSNTPLMNVTEYLENFFALGITLDDLPIIQPIFQKRIWDRYSFGDGTEKMQLVINELKHEDNRFHMEGGSWTNDISWVRGYENVLDPMERASNVFYEQLIYPEVSTDNPVYRRALYHLMCSQTSCYRYWGQGIWTEYGKELCRRTIISSQCI